MNTTYSVILDKRRVKQKSGTYPLKLQIIFNRKPKLYQTIFDLSEADYQKLSSPRINSELQKIKDAIKQLLREVEEFVGNLNAFTFFQFERDFVNHNERLKPRLNIKEPENGNRKEEFDFSPYFKRFPLLQEKSLAPGTIATVFLFCIQNLIKEERIGTALAYRDAHSSLSQFGGNPLFSEVTVSFLNRYEQWMLKKGSNWTTVGIKLRNLRAVFNEAISMGMIKKEKCYPFGKRKYQIPTGKNVKKALDQEIIRKLYFYEPESSSLRKAKDFWFFIYFGNGMNPKDLVHLKWKNMHGEYFVFTRAKTERTTRTDPRPITVYISDDMRRIIELYGTHDRQPDNYIFPIMNKELDPLKQYGKVPVFTRFINEGMKTICEDLGLDKKVTTIVSRHSFSTQLKRSGVSIEFIQEALGHTDKRTTENYLDSFENEIKKEFALKLMEFKKVS
jgi:integrase/recombinase XerD